MSTYLAVNENGEFRIFVYFWSPSRRKRPIMIKSNIAEEDFYGKEYYRDVPSGKYENVWSIYSNDDYNDGYKIDKKYLSEELQKLTWTDEPVKLD